jgi:general secretion pathway protein B
MSLILDALRKMEQERKARQGGGIDIRPEVLGRPPITPPRRSWGKPFILVAAGIAILAAGVGGGIMVKKGTTGKRPEQSRSTVRSEPSPSEEAVSVGVPPPPLPPAPVEPPPASAPPKPAPLPAPATAPAPRPVQRPAVAEQPAPSEYPGGDLTVSGIAWQEERSLRRAVVNGSLVGEGAEVAGARVVEIGERRVKFSQGGRTISISLSSPFQGR